MFDNLFKNSVSFRIGARCGIGGAQYKSKNTEYRAGWIYGRALAIDIASSGKTSARGDLPYMLVNVSDDAFNAAYAEACAAYGC